MADRDDLMEAVPIALARIGRDGRLASANRRALALLGPGRLGLHHVTALRQPGALAAVQDAMSGGAPRQARWAGPDDGDWTVTVSPLPDGGALLAFEDRSAGAAIGRQRSDFAANVSHELRTPLTAMIGFIETLRGPAREDPAARERFLSLMAREAARMDRLIADLLALSRVEGASRQRPTTPIALGPVMARVRETMLGRAGSAGVAIALDLPTDGGSTVRADADQIEQILANLVENALKYGAREGGTIVMALQGPFHDPALRGQAMRISVSDDGPGIDPSHLPRLTERFYRADDHRARGEGQGGTGLGLSIVKHIVQRHRGRMSLEGGLGRGLRVSVFLPTDGGPSTS